MAQEDSYDRASFCHPPQEDEVPGHDVAIIHHAFGLYAAKRDNLLYIEPGVVLTVSGSSLVVLDLRDEDCPKRKYVLSVDGSGVGAMAKHPSLPLLAVGEKGTNPNIYFFEYPTWKVVKVLKGGTERLYSSLTFSPDGELLASVGGSPDFMLTIWDWKAERITLHTKAFGQDIFKVKFSSDDPGRLITSGTGHIRFWRMAKTFTGLKLQGAIGKFGKVELSDVEDFAELPDGKVLSSTEAGALLVWEGNFIKCRIVRPGRAMAHDGPVTGVELLKSASGQPCAFMTTGADGRVCWWDFRTIDQAEIDADHSMDFECMPISEKRLGTDQDPVAIRGLIRGEHGGRHALVLDQRGKLWRVFMDESITEAVSAAGGADGSKQEDGDGDEPVPASADSCSLAVSWKGCKELASFHAGAVAGLDTSWKEHLAASAGKDGSVRLWDVANRRQIISGHWKRGASSLVWAPKDVDSQGKTVFTGFEDGVVRILSQGPKEWELVQAFKPHNGAVTSMDFAKGGTLLATSGSDGLIFLLTGEKKRSPGGVMMYEPIGFVTLPAAVSSVTWRSDGKALLAALQDGRVAEVNVEEEESLTPPNPESFELSPPCRLHTLRRPKADKKPKAQGATSANDGDGGAAAPDGPSEPGKSAEDQAASGSGEATGRASPKKEAGGGGGGGGGVEAGKQAEEELEEEEAERPMPPALQGRYFKNRMGHFLVSFGGDLEGKLLEYSFEAEEPLASYTVGMGGRMGLGAASVSCLRYTGPGSQLILTCALDGSVSLRRVGTSTSPLEFAFARFQIHDADASVSGRGGGALGNGAAAVTFDERFLVSGGADGVVVSLRLAPSERFEEAAKAKASEREKRLQAAANHIPFKGASATPPPNALLLVDGGAEGDEASNIPAAFLEGADKAVVEGVDAPRTAGGGEGEADITDPSAYSIQDAKLKSEEDQKRQLAEVKKDKVRQRIQELRSDFKALVEKNAALPEHRRLREDELLIDPEYSKILEDQGEAVVLEVRRECEYESEKAERRLNKLRERYLEPLETELAQLSAFLTGQAVSSFPTPKLTGQFKDLLERVHSAMRSEELRETRRTLDGIDAPGGSGVGRSGSARGGFRGAGAGGSAVGEGSRAGGRGMGSRIGSRDVGGPSSDGEARRGGNSVVREAPAGTEHKQSTFEVRKGMRAARKADLAELLRQQPGKDDDDPADVAAIAHAEAHMGDYKLKSAEDYEVPEDQAVDPEKKRRQIVLLDENILNIKQQFNRRFEELRSLKLQIVKGVRESNERVQEIDALLGESTPAVLFEPVLNPLEWRHERQLHTEEELRKFRDEVRRNGVNGAVPPPQSVVPGLDDSSAASLAEKRPPGVPLGLSLAASDALYSLKRGGVAAEVLPEALMHLPLASALGAQEALSAPAAPGDSAIEEDERQAEWALLRREREELLHKTREHVEAFDEALYELYKERLVLTVDLKAAEVRLSVLSMELGMLRKFEERDKALASKLVKCRGDKEEVVGTIADTQSKLQAKQEECARCREVEGSIYDEFVKTVPESHAFFPQLSKIFKRKIKRSKKLGDEDLDEDEEESEEEDEELDEDEDEDEDEEVDDSCPPGCDTQLYETVIEQRARRLDQEDKVTELQKSIDELSRTADRHVARQKQIDKDLTQTDKEIRSFQTEKQVKLNQLTIPVPLRLSQLCCFVGTEEAAEEADRPGEEGAEQLGAGATPAKLVSHTPMGEHVVFSDVGLVGQQRRIEELVEENKEERQNFKELHRNKNKLERAKVHIQAHIDAQQAKCDNLQMLRFGQLIDFETLDRGSAEDQGRLEMEARVQAVEQQGEKEVSSLERRQRGLKETLLHVTQENTGLLTKIADLSSRQYFLEKELNAASGGNVADAGPAVKSEVEEKNRLVSLVKLQAKEIDALKAEINLLRRKGGYVYIPTEQGPPAVPQIEDDGGQQPASFDDPSQLLDPSIGGSSMSHHDGPFAPPRHHNQIQDGGDPQFPPI